jgi:hypothetical protein
MKKPSLVTAIAIICIVFMAVLFVGKSNVASASSDEHNILYVASYIPGPWSHTNYSSTTEGKTQGNIVFVNPTRNSFNNLNMTIRVDGSETINPALRLWDSNYSLKTPNSFFESVKLLQDIQNFSTPITSINLDANQKETISLNIPSPISFGFNSHNLTIYISQNSFGDVINAQSLIVPQTQAYLQIVNFSAEESDEGTYHQYYDSTQKSNMVTVAYNPNFYQRCHNISSENYYADNFALMHYMGALDYSYRNVTVFNNNTFPVNSVTVFGQEPYRTGALIDYAIQPSETYLFPISDSVLPSYAYVTGYVTNNSATAQPTPTPPIPEFSQAIILLLLGAVTLAVTVRCSQQARNGAGRIR